MTPQQILLNELMETWHQTIPVTDFMKVRPRLFDGALFETSAPLEPNINLHQTMFAGSIYTLLTLTGWGLMWLKQREAGLTGSIVLAEANVRYLAPVVQAPVARARWNDGDLSPLAHGRRVKQQLKVELYSGDSLCAEFSGTYMSLPAK